MLEAILRGAEVLGILGGGGVVIFKLGRAVNRFELIGAQQSKEIRELKEGIQELQKLVVATAVFDTKMEAINKRLDRFEVQMDEFRHGEGLVLPFLKGPKP